MTQEEKAKRYDEAVEIAKEINNEHRAQPFNIMLKVFPELTEESKDERIRKELIRGFKSLNTIKVWNGIERTDILAWLEKQGEQKPADKVEPKFKFGNWYQCTKDFFGRGVTFDKNTAYYCAKEGCLKNEYGCHIAIVKDLYDNFKLWTIQDAKDGDVLEFGDHGRLVTGILSFVNKTTGKVDVSCLLEGNKFKVGVFYNLDTVKPHPVTKEQRDALFQKMKEAGYEWDAEKKELRKIEQKPVEWSEEDERIIDRAANYIKEYRWSDRCTNWCDKQNSTFCEKWLESLKNRCLPQQKQEWSEEDARTLYEVIHRLEHLDHFWNKPTDDNLIDWLKSLRPQNHWKSSEDEIKNHL